MAEGDRISVSEDKLYRALGELELRLVKHLAGSLALKAEAAHVQEIDHRVQVLEDSRIGRAHMETDVARNTERISVLERESLDHQAVRRAFKYAICSLGFGFAAAAADVYLVIHLAT